MPTEFTVTLRNTPGALAELGLALGRKGINIEALQSMSFQHKSVLHLVVNDPDAATRELEEYGLPFHTREVFVVDVHDEPGTLGEIAEAIAQAGVNIDSAYLTADRRVILGVSDLARATQIVASLPPSARG